MKYITRYRKFYEWCDEDLFGHIATSSTNSKILEYLYKSFKANPKKRKLAKKRAYLRPKKKFKRSYKKKFLYVIHNEEKEFKRKQRRFRSKEYFTLFKLRIFYGNLKLKTFKPLLNTQASNQNIWAGTSPFLLESRLDILLYRTNLFKSIFFIKQFIKHQGLLINGIESVEPNKQVNIGDLVILPKNFYQEFYEKFVDRLKKKKILTNFPKYMEMNYKIGAFTIFKLPQGSEIAYPFKVSAKLHWFIK